MIERRPDVADTDYDYYTEKPQDLRPLGKIGGWKVSRDTVDIRGLDLVDRNNNDIGKIDDLLMSMSAGQAIFATVNLNKDFGNKDILVPLDQLSIDREHKRVLFQGVIDNLRNSPEYRPDMCDYNPFYHYWNGVRSSAGYNRDNETREFRSYVVYPQTREEEEE